jgi:hypothetical protein
LVSTEMCIHISGFHSITSVSLDKLYQGSRNFSEQKFRLKHQCKFHQNVRKKDFLKDLFRFFSKLLGNRKTTRPKQQQKPNKKMRSPQYNSGLDFLGIRWSLLLIDCFVSIDQTNTDRELFCTATCHTGEPSY